MGITKTRITTRDLGTSSEISRNNASENAFGGPLCKLGRMSKSRMIILDVRPFSEFKRGALPDSINVPFSKAYRFDQTGSQNGDISESAINETENQLPILTEDLLETLKPSNRGGKLICV